MEKREKKHIDIRIEVLYLFFCIAHFLCISFITKWNSSASQYQAQSENEPTKKKITQKRNFSVCYGCSLYAYKSVKMKEPNRIWWRFSCHKIVRIEKKNEREHNLKKWWFLNKMTKNVPMHAWEHTNTRTHILSKIVMCTRWGRACRIYFQLKCFVVTVVVVVSVSILALNFNLIQRKNLSHSTNASGYIISPSLLKMDLQFSKRKV